MFVSFYLSEVEYGEGQTLLHIGSFICTTLFWIPWIDYRLFDCFCNIPSDMIKSTVVSIRGAEVIARSSLWKILLFHQIL